MVEMKEWTKEDLMETIANKGSEFVYFYTPICGTCQLAERMLRVVQELTAIEMKKIDLNYMPEIAEQLTIESVPCLFIIRNGEVARKVYAFQSVPHLHEILLPYL